MNRFLGASLALLLLCPVAAAADDAADVAGFYAGTLGNSLAVTLSLGQSGNHVHGYYHYDKYQTDIRVDGAMMPDGEVSLTEFGPFEITGTWTGRLVDGRFVGRWNAVDGKELPFSLDPVDLAAEPGAPTGRKVAFGALEENILIQEVRVPETLAVKLFDHLVEAGDIDPENEYQADVVALARTDPSLLFVGENLDLDDDGTPELAVRASGEVGTCSAQNCAFWIFRRQGGDYVEILADLVGYFGYVPLNQRTEGFLDLALAQHSSAAETAYPIFRFDGTAYRQETCVLKSYKTEDTFTYKEPCE